MSELRNKFVVEVTKEDIRHAERGDGYNCPIARAIKNKFKLYGGVWVNGRVVYIVRQVYYLSKPAIKKVADFDKGGRFPPGKIVLTKSM